jgi:hypothetical protein
VVEAVEGGEVCGFEDVDAGEGVAITSESIPRGLKPLFTGSGYETRG